MGKEQEMLKMKENLNANTVIPVGYIISLVWAEVKFSNGVVVYFSGEPDHPFNGCSNDIHICNKPTLNTYDDEMESNSDLDTADFHFVCDKSIQEAIVYSVIRYLNDKIQFKDYTKGDRLKKNFNSQQYAAYLALPWYTNANNQTIINTNSTAFKKYEQTYMPSIVEKADLGSMTASASDDASVEARSIETQTDSDSMRSTGVQTGQ